jgi:Protein of unknown function (DUF3558)
MVRTTLSALTVLAIGALAACGSSTTATTPTATPTAASAATPTPAPTPTAPGQTAAPTALDPCQLVPASEASALAGVTYGAGTETTINNGKYCYYGPNTTNVLEVIVIQAPSQAALDAGKAAALAGLAKIATKGYTTTILPIADGAAYLTGSGILAGSPLRISGIYVIKGLTFFGIVDALVTHAPPSSAAMQAEAQVVLTRVP